MKIKNNQINNISMFCQYTKAKNETTGEEKLVGMPARITVPAGATLEITDALWKSLELASKPLLAEGFITIVEAPKLSKEEKAAEKAVKIAAAKALLAEEELESTPAQKAAATKAANKAKA